MALPTSTHLDFEALLSRDYQPSRIAQLQVRPLPSNFPQPHHNNKHHHHTKQQQQDNETQEDDLDDDEVDEEEVDETSFMMSDEQRAFVLQLVTQTPAFLKHLTPDERTQVLLQQPDLLSGTEATNGNVLEHVPAKFSPLELTDWESKIDWGDEGDDNNNGNQRNNAANIASSSAEDPSTAMVPTNSNNPQHDQFLRQLSPLARSLLTHKRNPFLDTLNFDDTTIVGYGDPSELARKAAAVPLILELGVAGQSVAHKVYQTTALSAQRPTPAVLQYAYQARVDREWAGAEGKKGSGASDLSGLDSEIAQNVDARKLTKQQLNALIEARSRKREQMAKDKTNRVTAALGTLALGGGKGRTITSSLMGPGGTERTGRPSRLNAAGTLENDYVEQVDMVTSHSLVRDLSKVLLRQFHRPKLPESVVRQDLPWQFQIRFNAKAHQLQTDKQGPANTAANPQSPFRHHRGGPDGGGPAIRNEADLSPSVGTLVLLEYSEERPPVQLSRGMCTQIINYYRGDKAHCPVSAGGGDRPARRKRNDEPETDPKKKKSDTAPKDKSGLPRLTSHHPTTVLDWIGPLPKKPKEKMTSSAGESEIDVLPEGVTEILHANIQGPFLGEIPEGSTLTGLITNLFVAPLVRHEPESTDFLMVLTPPSGAVRAGQRESMGVILREFPLSTFVVGQTEPRTRVHAPTSPGEKNFTGPYISYQIARAISRSMAREGHGLRLDEMQARVLPNLELPSNAFRQRLKHVAIYDKNTQIWTTKQIGFEGYQGVEALGRSISPEGVTAFETACAASRRLADLGIHQLFSGNNMALSVGVTMIYMAGQLNAQRELSRKMKRLVDISRSSQKDLSSLQALYYEKAASEIEAAYKILRHKHEVAVFINEELQLAPWHLTGEFIDVHKKAEGTGMMKLTGLGDPSGTGEGFSFIREVDSKPSKSVGGNAALNAQVKKITGTEDDLRKLTMQQMASLLRSYGMAQKQIDTLKRWDRVHCIRDLSTKAASDGIGDGLERFARGEKLKLSEQKQMYRDRIQEIWRRQIAALSAGEVGDKGGADGMAEGDHPPPSQPGAAAAQAKKADDSDSESDDDDDLADAFEQEMMDRSEANQLVAAHTQDNSDTGLGQLRAATQDNEMSKDARDLFALRRQREEEKAAQEGLQSQNAGDLERHAALMANRKVIRKRITKTYPDGRQTTTFKFILHPEEVGKIEARLGQKKEDPTPRPKEWNYQYGDDEKPPGHAMFEDEDNFEYSSRGRLHSGKRRTGGRKRGDGRATPRARGALQFGKLKTKVSKEERMRKRKREEEELEVYTAQSKRKTTNNRRERGSIRDRRPHVIFADKLEAIRSAVESRPYASPFVKPVNRKLLPRYYEVISTPIDLQTIRDKISRYEYRTADALLKDFELMKSNAVKFNGEKNHIAQEAVSIYEFVRDQIQASQELSQLELAVENQMDPKKGGKKKKKSGDGTKKASVGLTAEVGGNTVNLGDIQQFMEDSDSGSEGEILLGL